MKTKTPSYDFFVSICSMTQGANVFGHSFMMISQLDRSQGKAAQVEVLEAIGFYSRYMPVLGYKPISRGRVKTEDMKDIIDRNGLYHKTFQISSEEMGKLLTMINQDRRLMDENEKPVKGTCEYKPGGPIFNLFKGDNCKRYNLQKLAALNIDIHHLQEFLEIPKRTPDLLPLKIVKNAQNDRIIWDSPLVLSPRTATDHSKMVKNTQQFNVLLQGVNNICRVLEKRQLELKNQGREVKEIIIALSKMKEIQTSLIKIQSYPIQIQPAQVRQKANQVKKIVKDCTQSLKNKGIESSLVNVLVDLLKEMFYQITYTIGLNTSSHRANSIDNFTLTKVGAIQTKMKIR